MFTFRGQSAGKRNQRGVSISPLLLSARELERAIHKERIRCDRYQLQFGLISLELYSNGSKYLQEAKELAKIFHRRLRITDERGHLKNGRLGILLPHTDRAGMMLVLDQIGALAAKKEIYFKSEVMNYPNDDPKGPTQAVQEPELVAMSSSPLSESVVQTTWESSYSKLNLFAYPTWKRSIDIVGASFGLILSLPFILFAAIAIKMNSNGPVFFLQKRTGFRGQEFLIYKLRTMVVNADGQKALLMDSNERDGPAFKMKDDPRITSVGRILRKIGLDELPQLWNVLIGDMALVGPRPLPCHEDAQCLSWQKRRLDTKPGITCTWQIAKWKAPTFADWMRMDIRYRDRRNLFADVRLLFQTVYAVVRGRVEQ